MLKSVSLILATALTSFNAVAPTVYNSNPLRAVENVKTLDGYSSVIKDLTDLKIDTSKSYQDGEMLALSQQVDLKNQLKTFVYLKYADDIYYESAKVSVSSTLDNVDNFTETYEMHDLKLVSYDDALDLRKFEILNVKNLKDNVRRYSVNKTVFNNATSNITNEFTYSEPKAYYFSGFTNETLEGYYKKPETITITQKEVADYCYGDSINFFGKETGFMKPSPSSYNDTWFIFFNTDRTIDNLMEVEITYTQVDYSVLAVKGLTKINNIEGSISANEVKNAYNDPSYDGFGKDEDWSITEHEPVIKVVEPGTKKVHSSEHGWFGSYKDHYETLDNIMDLRKYQAQDESAFVFTEYAKTYTWGVHFHDTLRQSFARPGPHQMPPCVKGSTLSDVCILRLKFETSGKLYNLLAVDTKTDVVIGEGAETPLSEDMTWFEKIGRPLQIIFMILFGIIGGFILYYLIKLIISISKSIQASKTQRSLKRISDAEEKQKKEEMKRLKKKRKQERKNLRRKTRKR